MEFFDVLFCFFSVCAAFVVKGLAGFGDPLVSTPLLSLRFPNSAITPGLLPVSLVLNIRMVWKNRAHFSMKTIWPISIFVLLGIIPGTLLLKFGSQQGLKLVLGLLIIGLGVEMLTRRRDSKAKPNAVLRSILSFFSGVTAGLFGINLLFLAYLERVSTAREDFRANVCFIFFLECVWRGILYAVNGMYTVQSLLMSLVALPAAFLGMYIGGLIDKRLSDKIAHRFIVYIFLLGGVSTVIYALLQLL